MQIKVANYSTGFGAQNKNSFNDCHTGVCATPWSASVWSGARPTVRPWSWPSTVRPWTAAAVTFLPGPVRRGVRARAAATCRHCLTLSLQYFSVLYKFDGNLTNHNNEKVGESGFLISGRASKNIYLQHYDFVPMLFEVLYCTNTKKEIQKEFRMIGEINAF